VDFKTPTWPIISKKTVNIRLPERIVDAVGNWKVFPKVSNPLKKSIGCYRNFKKVFVRKGGLSEMGVYSSKYCNIGEDDFDFS